MYKEKRLIYFTVLEDQKPKLPRIECLAVLSSGNSAIMVLPQGYKNMCDIVFTYQTGEDSKRAWSSMIPFEGTLPLT